MLLVLFGMEEVFHGEGASTGGGGGRRGVLGLDMVGSQFALKSTDHLVDGGGRSARRRRSMKKVRATWHVEVRRCCPMKVKALFARRLRCRNDARGAISWRPWDQQLGYGER